MLAYLCHGVFVKLLCRCLVLLFSFKLFVTLPWHTSHYILKWLYIQVHYGIKNVQVTTFGQPRIGNEAFATYYTQYVPNTIRVTHEHDMVPHLPPYYHYFPQKTYHHFPREVWCYLTTETISGWCRNVLFPTTPLILSNFICITNL